ncbi:MAG: hypothetical protein ACKVJU_19890 [Verrucomicrobiales bacterium]
MKWQGLKSIKRVRRVTKILLVTGVLISVGAIGLFVRQWLKDQPIEGGIAAYRPTDRIGRMTTSCGCGHKGYIVLTDRFVLWYVTGHDSIQPSAETLSRNGENLTIRKLSSPYSTENGVSSIKLEDKGVSFKEG